MKEALCQPIQLTPVYKDYVWGGNRLRPGISPTAEAWIVDESGIVCTPPFEHQTLGDLAAAYPEELLGSTPLKRTGKRFPLLIKLLDSAAWLSLQVHPNDEQARRLEGLDYSGKTEAWHVIEAEPEAQIIAGFRPGIEMEKIRSAIQQGYIIDYTQYLPVKAGETLFIRPGTIHSIGPGLLLYEVQQNSNLTYRVYDWGRPQTGTRVLHIEKSLEVVNPELHPEMIPLPELQGGGLSTLCSNPYFTLKLLVAQERALSLDTQRQSFHALTVLEQSAIITTSGGSRVMERFETAVIPAACGEYEVKARGGPVKMLLASVE